jgi:hypothetical protein
VNVTNDKSEDDNPANEAENVNDEREADEEVEDEEEEGDGIDPNMAAMMGFSGFGGSRKS